MNHLLRAIVEQRTLETMIVLSNMSVVTGAIYEHLLNICLCPLADA